MRHRRPTSAVAGVGVDQRAKAGCFGRHRPRAKNCDVIGDNHFLHVALKLFVHFGLLVGHFRLLAGLVHHLGTARDRNRVLEDLAVVANPVRWRLGGYGSVVSVNRCVVRIRRAQTIAAPLVQRLRRFCAACAGDNGGRFRVLARDEICQVFTDVGCRCVAGIGTCCCCHLRASYKLFCAMNAARSSREPLPVRSRSVTRFSRVSLRGTLCCCGRRGAVLAFFFTSAVFLCSSR